MKNGKKGARATGGKPRGARPVTGSTSAGRYGPGGNKPGKRRRY